MLSKETGIWRVLEMAQHWRGNIRRSEQVSGRGDRPILFFLELAEYLDFVLAIVVALCLLFIVFNKERHSSHFSELGMGTTDLQDGFLPMPGAVLPARHSCSLISPREVYDQQ